MLKLCIENVTWFKDKENHCKYYLAIRVWVETVKQAHPKHCVYLDFSCQQDDRVRIKPIFVMNWYLKLTGE